MKTINLTKSVRLSRPFSLALPARNALALMRTVLTSFFILVSLSSPAHAATDNDPFENVNRVTYKFNQVLDGVVVKPLARTYRNLTPGAVRKGIRNFFGNLDDVRTIFNEVLQLKLGRAASDIGRVAINSTLGLGGLVEVARPVFNLEKHNEDFGQTLASWNVKSGPYLVIPFFGPSTLRDSGGLILDSQIHPIPNIEHTETRNTLLASDVIVFREAILEFDELVFGDEYLFVREWYLQHREYLNNDGSVEIASLAFE
ncbi:MAG: hypothetical protein COA96_03240 [SAR86 cluster bacterium]|uniref:ABC transporter n=1 Tax=SAR86 cluster bacterium TaxID=2030880 RepID=A0A2A5B8T5_9GAMM|nr:MAG: hypothetical protein COA96_03240 [SAR86 cluster bacterium]